MKLLLLPVLTAVLLPGICLSAPADPPKKNKPATPAKVPGKPPAGTPVKPDAAPANPPAAAEPVILFSSVKSSDDLGAKLPKEMVTPRTMSLLGALRSGYRETVTGVALSPDRKQLFIVTADGSRHLFDDGRTKSAEQLLDEANVEDMFFHNYPLTNPTGRLPVDFDPGRARPEGLFKAIYGDSPAAVTKNLTTVSFAGKSVKFNRINGAAEALARAGKELEEVIRKKPELKLWLTNLGGTYNWRKIEGTERLSTHSYGIAIDLNTDKSKYWRWEKPATLATFTRTDFPAEVIEAFEHQGFVWGGKWYHYDTMHFEYRPEIIEAARQGVSDAPANPAPDAAAAPVSARHALLIDPSPSAGGKTRSSAALKASLEKCGFAVTLLTASDLGACIEGIERFTADASATDALLFHFSGGAIHHGGGIWLVPAGAKISRPEDVFAEAVPLTRILELLGKAKTAARIVLLDTPPPPAAAGEANAAPQFRAPGFFFGFAGSPSAAGARAWQPDVFTKSLAARIGSPRLSVSDMFTFVIQDVEKESGGAQKPQSASTLPAIFRFAEAEPEPKETKKKAD